MRKMRLGIIALCMLLGTANAAVAGVTIGIGLPNVSIGISLPLFPELVPVPGYPVYYAPEVPGNYFFYDGMYWVYQNDNWYASSWYNGPWALVDPYVVPLFVLRVPVRYYRQPPYYFRGWRADAPPRWGEHWGRSWEERRRGWDHWKHGSAPRRAPLPTYQRHYAGHGYPGVEQQKSIRSQNYHYQPRNQVVRRHLSQVEDRPPAAERGRREMPHSRSPQRQEMHHPPPQHAPEGMPQQRGPRERGEQHAPRDHGGQRGYEQQGGHEQRGQERGEHGGHGQGHGRDEGHGR